MKLKKVFGVVFVLSFLCVTMVGGLAFGQEKFPTKPVTIYIPWSAGGSHDLATRAMQPTLEEIFGQAVIVTNKTGAGATLAFGEVQNSAPDGYTICICSTALNIVKYTIPKAGIDYLKFEPLAYIGYTPYLLVVRNEAPWKTWKEFMDNAKANPGKVSVANGGFGIAGHMLSIDWGQTAGVKFVHTPYKGTNAAVLDLLGGHVNSLVAGLTDMATLIRAGKVRALAVFEGSRNKYIADVPSIKELLGVTIDHSAFWAFVGPKGIPKERVNILYNALKKSTESKKFTDYMVTNWANISVKGPEEFGKMLQEKDKRYKELITSGELKLN